MRFNFYKSLITPLLLFILPSELYSQNNYSFVWDKNSSSISNSNNLLSIHKIIYEYENKKIKTKYWNENNFKRKLFGVGYRFAKTILVDYQIDFVTHLIQHEVFGHGYRYREFEYTDNSYNIKLFPPYSSGGGFAVRGTQTSSREIGIHEEISIRSGGMEAASVLSNSIKERWLKKDKINYRESLLYLSTFHDYTLYILSTKLSDNDSPGNDVNNYLRFVNESYGYFDEDSYALTIDDISTRASINFVNTFSLFAAFTYFKVYLFDGLEEFEYPSVNIGNRKWLPSVRFGLTPFGSELIVENYLISNDELIGVNVRSGDNRLDDFWGLGLFYDREKSEKTSFNIRADLWVQPELELGGINKFITNDGLGGRIIGEVNHYFSSSFPVGLYGQLGYKTSGFIEGEVLDAAPIIRIGISFKDN